MWKWVIVSLVLFVSCTSSPVDEQVIENQTGDFERMFDRYIACMDKGSYQHKRSLEEDFFLYAASLDEYQLSPTVENRDSYLTFRAVVSARLDDCL